MGVPHPHCDALQDVEGFEPAVMTTAKRLLSDGAIDNLIMEYTPGVLERAARYVTNGVGSSVHLLHSWPKTVSQPTTLLADL
jgi:hypothetical protein